MTNDFINLFTRAMFGEISPEELLIKGCGLSPEDAKEIIDEVNWEAENTNAED